MAPKKQVDQNELMVVNDSPGEECRIAILQDGHMEELYTERTSAATNVGNIYKGRVVNVEPAIQAAFIDYGEGANGFLHISDLHPKYFPSGSERTERVGKKIPRRDRPPIQAALRRGDEILVQVLKEGIGTKGPTLTSYLSIPGRLLVLMPDMDRVGVSRRVEDEAKRRAMREILDSLDLPEGFGFILRTAGFEKTKTELKRDAAYLMRLWKVMEKRIKSVRAPCELYTESDLLIRTVRDVLRPSIKAIVVDSASGFERISMFLQVVTPRSAPRVIRYRRPTPIFHAFDVERQIELIHAREVPLPSGGRLVIDQTEAVVAIDVNSGRSRSARDSETNAYETNCEAADEICRQLRLRDLGGLIINDLIDMRSPKHRRQIEERFELQLKRDRAKATALRISEFGILEMTRQRMRPSLRKSHFMPCPMCSGHGEIKVPDYVAADAARHAGFLLQFERVARVEIVCSPRVASVMLSGKRRELVRLEDASGKRIDVRVSDAIAVDRVDYYAYDERNADIDITRLPQLALPTLEALESDQAMAGEAAAVAAPPLLDRRRRPGPADATEIALAGGFDDELGTDEEEQEQAEALEATGPVTSDEAGRQPPMHLGADGPALGERHSRRRRRRRRRGSGQQQPLPSPHEEGQGIDAADALSTTGAAEAGMDQDELMVDDAKIAEAVTDSETGAISAAVGDAPQSGSRRSRRRRGRRRTRGDQHAAGVAGQVSGDGAADVQPQETSTDGTTPVRIHELARELSVSSREVIERCEPDPAIHHVTNALSSVSPEEADAIRSIFSTGAEPTEQAQPPGPAQQPSRRSRRRRGGRRSKAAQGAVPPAAVSSGQPPQHQLRGPSAMQPVDQQQPNQQQAAGGRRRRRRRGRKPGSPAASVSSPDLPPLRIQGSSGAAGYGGQAVQPAAQAGQGAAQASGPVAADAARTRRRALYRAGRGTVSAAARERSGDDE